ncbi:MAG: HNH endonuclease, partial [Actinomycetia bacterium]|nr:HNH endonuclease [Actinomycetes bacterium]
RTSDAPDAPAAGDPAGATGEPDPGADCQVKAQRRADAPAGDAPAGATSQPGPQPADGRTKRQRMADALIQLARDALAGGCSHCWLTARPHGPAVNVTVALSTLLELDDQPADLNGDPAPASIARTLAADPDATWRRLVTDEIGHLIDAGRDTHRPPASLRRHVVNRHRRCAFPGCARRATTCDIDHTTAWENGGTTSAANLLPLCPRHHHFKHEAGWKLELTPWGAAHWTSPTGQIYWTQPTTHPLDHTSDFTPGDLDTEDSDATDFDASDFDASDFGGGDFATADPPIAASTANGPLDHTAHPETAHPVTDVLRHNTVTGDRPVAGSTANAPGPGPAVPADPAPAGAKAPDWDDPPPF